MDLNGIRTTFLDYDARREPKTDEYCIRCQRDLKQGQRRFHVHLVSGGTRVLHPADETLYEARGGLADPGEMGWHPIGADCARLIGMEFCSTQGGQ